MFTWLLQPAWNWKKLSKSSDTGLTKQANQERMAAEKQIEELNETHEGFEGEMPEPKAPVTPVKTTGTGINSSTKVGLNLI